MKRKTQNDWLIAVVGEKGGEQKRSFLVRLMPSLGLGRELRLLNSYAAVVLLTIASGTACSSAESVQLAYSIDVQAPVSAVVLEDINRDDRVDLLVATSNSEILVYLGSSNGEFQRESQIGSGPNPGQMATGDLDGDGKTDIAIANHETDYVTILRGDGDGAFSPFPVSQIKARVKPHLHYVRVLDINQDGHMDLAVDDRAGKGVRWLAGNGSGKFDSDSTALIDSGGDPYLGFAFGNLNNDSLPDLVTPNARSVGVVLFGDDQWQPALQLGSAAVFSVGLVDIDQDGHLDILAATVSGELSAWFGGKGDDISDKPYSLDGLSDGAKSMIEGDFNGDGYDDIAIGNYNGPSVTVVYSSEAKTTREEFVFGSNPWSLAAGDVNGDGVDDLVVGDAVEHKVYIRLNGAK